MKTLRTIILALLLAAATACTQNHGHIGRLFGSWFLYDMTVDGTTPEAFGTDELFWSFQSDLIMVSRVQPHQAVGKSYGTWSETEGTLTVNFTYSDPSHPAGTHTYGPPSILGWSHTEPVTMEYVLKKKKEMILKRTSDDGKEYVYYLKKTY